jgi:hypothetical protein
MFNFLIIGNQKRLKNRLNVRTFVRINLENKKFNRSLLSSRGLEVIGLYVVSLKFAKFQ